MINLQSIQWKIHLDPGTAPDPQEWFRVLGTWIPDSPEIFVDVCDYSHVEDGPVVFLSGHHVAYSLDASGRRLGLVYEGRQPVDGTNAEKLSASLTAILKATLRLESDTSFQHKPLFLGGDLKFIVNSRAIAPNNESTFAELKPELESLLGQIYGTGNFSMTRDPDVRQRFAVHVKAFTPISVTSALKKLG